MINKYRNNGLLSMLLATVFFSLTGLSVKMLSPALSPSQLLFLRAVIWIVLSLPFLRRSLPPAHHPRQQRLFTLLMLRSVVGVIGMLCGFYAIGHLPLSTANVLFYTYPVFIALLAPLIVGEPLSRRLGLILASSFIGILFIIKPQSSDDWLPMMIGLGGGVSAAIAHLTIRKLGKEVNSSVIVLAFALTSLLVATPLFIIAPAMPATPAAWWWIILLGVSSSLAQLLMTHSYRVESASRASIVSYFTVLFAMIWDILLWSYRPDLWTLLGSALIIGGGVYLHLKQSQNKDDQEKAHR